jgi:IclR family mhp operon transcriptional activator
MSNNTTVRGLIRGLNILKTMNLKTEMSALELSKQTGIPRPTVYRLLDTLIEEGYVKLSPDVNRYRLTIAVNTLSAGFNDDLWISDIAAPLLGKLTEKVIWPSDIATFADGSMVIRETTNKCSPLAIVRERIGFHAPFLESSMGQAYLAFCDERTKEQIIETLLMTSEETDNKKLYSRYHIDQMIRKNRNRGYSLRVEGIVPKTFSIGLPILVGGVAKAAINIICISSAMSVEDAIARYLDELKITAEKIGQALERENPEHRL